MQWLSEGVAVVRDVLGSIGLAQVLDILLIAVLLYQLIRIMRNTRASQVMRGVLLVLVVAWLAQQFGLRVFGQIMQYIISTGIVILVILFQPELRRAMEQIGRGTFMEQFIRPFEDKPDQSWVVDELVRVLLRLSHRKVGALIVIEHRARLTEALETGTPMDSRISAPLLENIFEPNTPLHDGAVILRGDRIVAAACILHLTDDTGLARDLGTRHRAAIGVTETSDAWALIVSEETGTISMAREGRLNRYLDEAALRRELTPHYGATDSKPNLIDTLRKRRKPHGQ